MVEEMPVPEILLGGHHEKIESWRQDQRERRTKDKRPDLWGKYTKMKESEKNNE
jgi:tRNA (guanine37-N1)-methyltransferase|tara:strand:+ start:105 stop:266 length:162 start_codon:yes stop_codon:yes gene_type:complete